MGMMNDGTEVGICNTLYGTIGVLICYDAERPAFVEETVAHSPNIIFNPANLSSFQGIPQTLIHSSWKVALDTSSRYFEHLSQSTGITFVRCDRAKSGNTFITTSTQTVFIPSYSEQYLSALIPSSHFHCPYFPYPESQLPLVESFGRIRTERLDNTGMRSTIHSIPRKRKTPKRRGKLLKVGVVLPRGRPKGRIVIFTTSSLEVWDPLDSSLYYSFEVPNEQMFTHCLIEEEGLKALDDQNVMYHWTPSSKDFNLLISGSKNEISKETFSGVNEVQICDECDRTWSLDIDFRTDLQCPLALSDHFTPSSIFSSSLCFRHGPSPSCIYRIILPVSCHYQYFPSHCPPIFHYDHRLLYLPIVTEEFIHLVSFFHNRVAVKIRDVLSAIELNS